MYTHLTTWRSNTVYDVGFKVIYKKMVYMSEVFINAFDICPEESSKWLYIRNATVFDYYSDSLCHSMQWRASRPYSDGDVVQHNFKLYVSNTTHTSNVYDQYEYSSSRDDQPQLTTSLWDYIDIMPAGAQQWFVNTVYDSGDIISYYGSRFIALQRNGGIIPTDDSVWEPIGEDWEHSHLYAEMDRVYFGKQLYECTDTHMACIETLPCNDKYWRVAMDSCHHLYGQNCTHLR